MKKISTTLFLLVLVTLNVVVANAASSEDFSDGEITGCTIRTTQKTVGYQKGKAITIPKDKKLEAIKEKKGNILVFYKEKKVWIHTKSVLLINVAEYIPSIDINLAMAKKKIFFLWQIRKSRDYQIEDFTKQKEVKMEKKHGFDMKLLKSY